jgi:hypothetical protein
MTGEIAVVGAGAVRTVAAPAAEQSGLDVGICARSPVGAAGGSAGGTPVAASVICTGRVVAKRVR